MIAGAALAPPSALNLMKAEINRLIVLTTDAVVPIPIEVPRRQLVDFHQDLFPPVRARRAPFCESRLTPSYSSGLVIRPCTRGKGVARWGGRPARPRSAGPEQEGDPDQARGPGSCAHFASNRRPTTHSCSIRCYYSPTTSCCAHPSTFDPECRSCYWSA